MPPNFTFSLAVGFRTSSQRALGFLESPDDPDLNARSIFDGLRENQKRIVRTRIDHWIDGGKHDRYFHGWPNRARYKGCFVFKWKKGRVRHRLYGFLCHPIPHSNRAFQLCVLVNHAAKTQEETDFSILDRIERLHHNPQVIGAIAKTYWEYGGGAR